MIDTLRHENRLERREPKHNPRRDPTREDSKSNLSWTVLATFIKIGTLPTQSLRNRVFVCRRAGGRCLFRDRASRIRWLEHIVADLPSYRVEILSHIDFRLTVNALQDRDVLHEGHRALC